MTLFFGFVGLWNILFMWPVGVLLHFTGVEKFEIPRGGELWASIMINASITFVRPEHDTFFALCHRCLTN
jgi:solute carrier family 35 protein F5